MMCQNRKRASTESRRMKKSKRWNGRGGKIDLKEDSATGKTKKGGEESEKHRGNWNRGN